MKKDYTSAWPIRLEVDQRQQIDRLSKESAVKLDGADLVRIAIRYFLLNVEVHGLGGVICQMEKMKKPGPDPAPTPTTPSAQVKRRSGTGSRSKVSRSSGAVPQPSGGGVHPEKETGPNT